MMIDLIKCHGSGNDFILIDEMNQDYGFSEKSRRDLAIRLCDRVNSIGADGVLYILESKRADAVMRVFNADGSEASMCGNGLRCAARYICEKLGVDRAVVETMKADLEVSMEGEIFPGIPAYRVEISPVTFNPADLPMNTKKQSIILEKVDTLPDSLKFTAIAVPNPHLVAIVDKEVIGSGLQKEISERLNGPNELFPDGVNVSFIGYLGPKKIYVRTYERGVGFTNACGTAMSASTLVTCLAGLNKAGEQVEVYNNGGMVRCTVLNEGDRYKISLTGNATYEFRAKVDALGTLHSQEDFGEEALYKKLQEHAQHMISEAM